MTALEAAAELLCWALLVLALLGVVLVGLFAGLQPGAAWCVAVLCVVALDGTGRYLCERIDQEGR